MRWLSHRGGALDFQEFKRRHPGENFPVAVALGADPATILGAVTPVPDTLSEYAFAGLLRDGKTEVTQCVSNTLQVPAHAEIILEGYIAPDEMAPEGPYGDHTGYYNEVDDFPVFTVTHITMRKQPIYHSTYTGRPPDEPAVLGWRLTKCLCRYCRNSFQKLLILSATRRLLVPSGGGDHEEAIRRTRQTSDDGGMEFLTPIYVHQVCHCL